MPAVLITSAKGLSAQGYPVLGKAQFVALGKAVAARSFINALTPDTSFQANWSCQTSLGVIANGGLGTVGLTRRLSRG